MAINQKIAPAPVEYDQNCSHNSSSPDNSSSPSDEKSLSCSECERDHGQMAMIMKSLRRGSRPSCVRATAQSLRASTTFGKSSRRARRLRMKMMVNANPDSAMDKESGRMMMKRLHSHLASLRSLLPPTARSAQSGNVIADALRYKKTLKKEIQLLLTALPYYHQVDVRSVECGGLQIGVACKKKSGLMVALMEAMESFGLHFNNVSVSCQDGNITIDARSSQDCGGEKAGALKGILVATISRFSQRQ